MAEAVDEAEEEAEKGAEERWRRRWKGMRGKLGVRCKKKKIQKARAWLSIQRED